MTAQPPVTAIVRAGKADTEALTQLIADAFFPLAPCQWLIPDQAARRAIFPAYFRMYVEHALADGIVHTTPDRDAAALWIPIGPQPLEPPAGYHEHLAEITGPWAHRFTAFDTELDAHHLTGTRHHHLAILAVRPDRQRHGTGTALLTGHHAHLDQQGITAYLEASGENTRRIYLHHGYEDYGTPIYLHDGLLASSHGDPSGQPSDPARMYPMVRYPKAHAPGDD